MVTKIKKSLVVGPTTNLAVGSHQNIRILASHHLALRNLGILVLKVKVVIVVVVIVVIIVVVFAIKTLSITKLKLKRML